MSAKNNAEKMVSIKMGYDCTLLAPVSKAGPLLALLASCQVCSTEWVNDRPGIDSCLVMVVQDRRLAMEFGDFEVLTREGYEAALAQSEEYKQSKIKAAESQPQADADGPF